MEQLFTALFLFAGIGAGALGFLNAQVSLRGRTGRFRSLGGIDNDAVACRDFERLTKSPALVADINGMTPEALRAFAGPEAPDVIFMSPPCKGFSGLMAPKKARSRKYREMNLLALAGVELVLRTWGKDGPGLILLENVPRIATRGSPLLRRIRRRLAAHGYVTHEGPHDCGEIGNLAQHRWRFLMVARHQRKVPVFLYQPAQRGVRPCGEVLESLPLPGDRGAGRLHQLPAISLRTWLRLAAIRPGHDWRDLQTLGTDEDPFPNWARYTLASWLGPTGAVAGGGTNGAWGAADVRLRDLERPRCWYQHVMRVVSFDTAAGTVVGSGRPAGGAQSVADHRLRAARWHRGVMPWVAPTGTITGSANPTTGAFSIADARLLGPAEDRTWHKGKFGVMPTDRATRTVIGGPSNGADYVADLRVRAASYPHTYGLLSPTEPAFTITGNAIPGGGAFSVADLRLGCAPWQTAGVCGVLAWSQPSYTVTASLDLWAGWGAVADPRIPANPDIAVRWFPRDLDAPPPYVPFIPGRGDGSWHRPLTTLELAALQGLPTELDGAPLDLSGPLTLVREHIGNAVPVQAATAVAGEMLKTLVLASAGAFMLSSGGGVWVDRAREGIYRRGRNGVFPLYPETAREAARRLRRVGKRRRVGVVGNASLARVTLAGIDLGTVEASFTTGGRA